MKKKLVLLIGGTFILLTAHSQNVGIGTNSPTETLDVNGNVNVSGNLKVNGVAGEAGQTLITNNTGATQWGTVSSSDGGQYKNFVGFSLEGAVPNWQIPVGVKKILVEAWGAGGGGSVSGGGGGGGYVRTQIGVSAGAIVNITLGSEGAGSQANTSQAGGNGGNTIVSIPDSNGTVWYAVAFGGQGAYVNPGSEFYSSYNEGGISYVASAYPISNLNQLYPYYDVVWGEHGFPATLTFTQVQAGIFAQEQTGGMGGNAGNTYNTGAGGARRFINTTPYVNNAYSAARGKLGGGGGGGLIGLNGGADGGGGKVVIWY